MIVFASLFLGLVVGVQPVRLLVSDEVARVELLLDGREVGTVAGEPWTVDCDFGAELLPHELVAVARDAEGRETGRVRQWVNLPKRSAEAVVSLEGGEGGRGVFARLVWDSVAGADPLEVRARFDGRRLKVDDPRRIALPAHDPQRLHFLSVELDFAGNVGAVAETVFGGSYADEVSTRLTALPLALDRGAKLPKLEHLRGRFSKDGVALEVIAAEEGPAEIVIVRDEAARSDLTELGRTDRRALRDRARVGLVTRGDEDRGSLRYRMGLKSDLRLRFVWPYSRLERRAGYDLAIFPPSQDFTWKDGGLYWLMAYVRAPIVDEEPQRLADAVAAAGLLAAGRNRRRAVVLVLGGGGDGEGQFEPAAARRFLASLRVPLLVWSTVEDSDRAEGPWGRPTEVSNLARLEQAVGDLYRRLERQRIVWLAGIHLPHRLDFREGDGVRLVR